MPRGNSGKDMKNKPKDNQNRQYHSRKHVLEEAKNKSLAKNARDLYEKFSQISIAERQEEIKAELERISRESFDNSMERQEIFESEDGQEKRRRLIENDKEREKIVLEGYSLKEEQKEIDAFPKVKRVLEYIGSAEGRLKEAKEARMSELESEIEEEKEKIEKLKEAKEKETVKIARLNIALDALEGESDLEESLKERITQTEEKISGLDNSIEVAEGNCVNKIENLNYYNHGQSEIDLYINRCENPWEEILYGKNFKEIANMQEQQIDMIIKVGVNKDNDKGKDEEESRESDDNKDESRRNVNNQASKLQSIINGGGQSQQESEEELEENEEESEEKDEEAEEEKEEDNDGSKKKGVFAGIKEWIRQLREERAEKAEQKAIKNELIIQRIVAEEGRRPGKFRVFVERVFNDNLEIEEDNKIEEELQEENIGKRSQLLWEDEAAVIEQKLDELEGEMSKAVEDILEENADEQALGEDESSKNGDNANPVDTTVHSGPETEGSSIEPTEMSKERAKNTADGLANLLAAGEKVVGKIKESDARKRSRLFKASLNQEARGADKSEEEQHSYSNENLNRMSNAARQAIDRSNGRQNAKSAPSTPAGGPTGGPGGRDGR